MKLGPALARELLPTSGGTPLPASAAATAALMPLGWLAAAVGGVCSLAKDRVRGARPVGGRGWAVAEGCRDTGFVGLAAGLAWGVDLALLGLQPSTLSERTWMATSW